MEQKIAFNVLKTGANVFLTGGPGTGKTFLLNQYINFLRENKINYSVVAPTGIAAMHVGGSTVHSFFGLGISDRFDDMQIDAACSKRHVYQKVKDMKVLVLDEVSMLSPEIFGAIDGILKNIKQTKKVFGGIQVVLCGDFFQLPPVQKVKKIRRFAYHKDLWETLDLKVCYLKQKFRQQKGEKLISILDEMRSGSVSEDSMTAFRGRYNKDPQKKGNKNIKLFTHNADVESINQKELDSIENSKNFFIATKKGSKRDIEKIFSYSMVLEKLELKVDALVVFIKNNINRGYINGTVGKVVSFDTVTGNPQVEIFSGRVIDVLKEEWTVGVDSGAVTAIVEQLPLRLAWAMTVHKSQGMTLDSAEIDLSKTFEKGQGYVALSRLKTLDNLKLLGLNQKALEVDPDVIRIDKIFQKKSNAAEEKFKKYTNQDVELFAETFVELCGGDFVNVYFDCASKKIQKTQYISKIDRYEKTKKMLEKKMDIKTIAKQLELTENTIINHILKIKEKDSSLDLSFYKPKKEILESVKIALQKTGAKKAQNGKYVLKPIFQFLEGRYTYKTISLSIAFL